MTNRTPRPKLRSARLRLGWSKERAADEVSRRYPHLAIDARQIGRWESGETRRPRPMNVLALCATYGLPPEELDLPPIPGADLASDLPDASSLGRYASVSVSATAAPPARADLTNAVIGALGALVSAWNAPRSSAVAAGQALVEARTSDLYLLTAPDMDSLRHIVAALGDAHHYMDRTVVDHLRRGLARCEKEDGAHGPHSSLPMVLAIIAAIDSTAREARPHVRQELLALGAQAAEFAGFLHRDMAAPRVADHWWRHAIRWARETDDRAMEAYVLLKMSQAAWDLGDARRMLELAQAAQAIPVSLPARVRAEAAQQEARGLAMLGGSIDVIQRMLDSAHTALADDRHESGSGRGAHYHTSLLGIQTAICYCEAGDPRRAVDLYRQHLSPDVFSRRDYGYFLSLMAGTLAISGEPDDASRLGVEAAAIATATRSGRTIHALFELVTRLAPWSNRPSVCELRAALVHSA